MWPSPRAARAQREAEDNARALEEDGLQVRGTEVQALRRYRRRQGSDAIDRVLPRLRRHWEDRGSSGVRRTHPEGASAVRSREEDPRAPFLRPDTEAIRRWAFEVRPGRGHVRWRRRKRRRSRDTCALSWRRHSRRAERLGCVSLLPRLDREKPEGSALSGAAPQQVRRQKSMSEPEAPSTEKPTKQRCGAHNDDPYLASCDDCLGFGWRWSDGRPATLCPGGGNRPLVKEPMSVPCGRSLHCCPGCDREWHRIGLEPDIKRTKKRLRG